MTYQVWYQEPIEVVGLWRRDLAYSDQGGAWLRAEYLFETCGNVGCVRIVAPNGTVVYQRGLEDR